MNKLIPVKALTGLLTLITFASCLTSVKTKKPAVVDPTLNTEVVIVEAPTVSKTFHTELKTKWVVEAIKVANCVLNHPDFKKKIEEIEKFDYSELNGVQVYAEYSNGSKCGVRTYKTKNPWSSAIATTYNTDKEFLYLNTRKFPFTVGKNVGVLSHECGHLKGFSHGDNRSAGKENSVNYKVGSIAQEISELCLK
tara:strand:- start:5628 stop:6212 length:585 start_codon:yes stop_codon:yes gene_type:complete